jgi:hypothetical protein
MSVEKLKGRGRLVPTRPTGLEYEVEYGIRVTVEIRAHGSSAPVTSSHWEKCEIRSPHRHSIPDGSYFLHPSEGRLHQLKSVGGKWQRLAVAS